MSGIFGMVDFDGAPIDRGDLGAMAAKLRRRGPEGTGEWSDGSVGLGHTLLATTPEAVIERLPLEHSESGCVITADVRLDNRAELLGSLGLLDRAPTVGDGEIVLFAYLRWGERCVEHLLGDFAFAIWDPANRRLTCGRDHMGLRPFYFHSIPGKFFAFASEPEAILAVPRVPTRVDESRIADYLLADDLEGADRVRTFYEGVSRLPPAHVMVISEHRTEQRRFWRPEPGQELRLPTDRDYEEAFLEVFHEAVRCRLRSDGPVASMLSGGMDSGSIAAIAANIMRIEGTGPLSTFSAVSPKGRDDIETSFILDALGIPGILPTTVSFGDLSALMPEVEQQTWSLTEPFDYPMTMVRCIYLAAHRAGHKVVLDGVAGDIVFSPAGYLADLVRAGRVWRLTSELRAQARFWDEPFRPVKGLVTTSRGVLIPDSVRRLARSGRVERVIRQRIDESFIDPGFALRSGATDRLRASFGADALVPTDCRSARSRSIDHPHLTAARERYGRIASSVGVEERDPFLDTRVIAFCLSLPGDQVTRAGWPKFILRRSVAGLLPDSIRWRRGREHVGWLFTHALLQLTQTTVEREIEQGTARTASYINNDAVSRELKLAEDLSSFDADQRTYQLAHLARWLSTADPELL